ncbi:uncharacterized protein LOC135813008 [Sycon ciliatum]|uniref:uncharacterized protein LOC135813008 n=1 Tax=Sycon ciliatum TaxID=27933 RepID=UPI0031F64248
MMQTGTFLSLMQLTALQAAGSSAKRSTFRQTLCSSFPAAPQAVAKVAPRSNHSFTFVPKGASCPVPLTSSTNLPLIVGGRFGNGLFVKAGFFKKLSGTYHCLSHDSPDLKSCTCLYVYTYDEVEEYRKCFQDPPVTIQLTSRARQARLHRVLTLGDTDVPLNCPHNGSADRATVEWTHNGTLVPDHTSLSKARQRSYLISSQSGDLIIQQVTWETAGAYKCKVIYNHHTQHTQLQETSRVDNQLQYSVTILKTVTFKVHGADTGFIRQVNPSSAKLEWSTGVQRTGNSSDVTLNIRAFSAALSTSLHTNISLSSRTSPVNIARLLPDAGLLACLPTPVLDVWLTATLGDEAYVSNRTRLLFNKRQDGYAQTLSFAVTYSSGGLLEAANSSRSPCQTDLKARALLINALSHACTCCLVQGLISASPGQPSPSTGDHEVRFRATIRRPLPIIDIHRRLRAYFKSSTAGRSPDSSTSGYIVKYCRFNQRTGKPSRCFTSGILGTAGV